jgi:vacuolar-type H+-ATPase subunit E/Vma4
MKSFGEFMGAINELSVNTLNRYRKKGSDQYNDAYLNMDSKTEKKRGKGLDRADAKVAKKTGRFSHVSEDLDDLAHYDEVNEQTVHLVPHGGKGTHFKVVKGIKGQLDAGEVIHDSHVDDLHDVGIKTKILKEDQMSDEERTILEGVDIVDGEMITELSRKTVSSYVKKAAKDLEKVRSEPDAHTNPVKGQKQWRRYRGLDDADYKLRTPKSPLNKVGVQEKAPDFNAPETSKEDEIKIARGQMHGDYKGHQAAMKKKHNITETTRSDLLEKATDDIKKKVKAMRKKVKPIAGG